MSEIGNCGSSGAAATSGAGWLTAGSGGETATATGGGVAWANSGAGTPAAVGASAVAWVGAGSTCSVTATVGGGDGGVSWPTASSSRSTPACTRADRHAGANRIGLDFTLPVTMAIADSLFYLLARLIQSLNKRGQRWQTR